MNAHEVNASLAALLHNNPNVIAAWIGSQSHAQTLQILTDAHHVPGFPAVTVDGKSVPIFIPQGLGKLPYNIEYGKALRDLRCYLPIGPPLNEHQECQDEPVRLGTQIQPRGKPWVGTAGLPVKWLDQGGKPFWGFLSNWHVMCGGPCSKGHPQHQPDDLFPVLGHLADWNQITGKGVHYLDAAIATAHVDGYHTIDNKILGLDEPNPGVVDATPGLAVVKSGRTTSVTNATCKAIHAAVKVSYGDFVATFADQDVFEHKTLPFSAPGDSGSCILSADCICPCSLLFAGGGKLTIGNPMRYAVQRFNLLSRFN